MSMFQKTRKMKSKLVLQVGKPGGLRQVARGSSAVNARIAFNPTALLQRETPFRPHSLAIRHDRNEFLPETSAVVSETMFFHTCMVSRPRRKLTSRLISPSWSKSNSSIIACLREAGEKERDGVSIRRSRSPVNSLMRCDEAEIAKR